MQHRKASGFDFGWLRRWFDLTPDEKKVLAGILAIALIGLTARYIFLKNQKPEPYVPKEISPTEYRGGS